MRTQLLTIDQDNEGQRVDNFLFTRMKGVPKSRVYKALRKGEVRVNKKRVKPTYRLALEDVVRVPPLRQADIQKIKVEPSFHRLETLESRILYEDKQLLIMNKPSGLPVHGGSGVDYGIIEALRVLRPHCSFLELVHRLDKNTSGCLLVAKKRQILIELQSLLRNRQVSKKYWALVKGRWQGGTKKVDFPLIKQTLESGGRIVKVDYEQGRNATSIFRPVTFFSEATLMEVNIKTGRTHQIRVHAAQLGYPLAGDDKYGDDSFNRKMKKQGLNRIFLHANQWSCYLADNRPLGICSLLDSDLSACLSRLKKSASYKKPSGI